MASTVLYMCFLAVLFGAVLTMPVSLKVKKVSSSKGVQTKTELVLDGSMSRSEYTKLVHSALFEAFPSLRQVKRTKRQVVVGPSQRCPGDMVEFAGRCWTPEECAAMEDCADYFEYDEKR